MAEPGPLEEHAVDCPCCGARFTALVDPSEAGSEYIQDCEVCCNPLRFGVAAADTGDRVELVVAREDDA